jgi:broad specificity phosphatase PhoE
MSVSESVGLRILIVRPGTTDLDEQGRIAGSLDVPLSETGRQQIVALRDELKSIDIDRIYSGPSSASRETADLLSQDNVRIKQDDDLKNFDYGLWHGKRIDELKKNQPKLFRLWQDQPQSVCPPGGETIEQLVMRAKSFIKKIRKKQRGGTVVVVAAEPVACVLRSILESVQLSEYWTTESNCGSWDSVFRDASAAE